MSELSSLAALVHIVSPKVDSEVEDNSTDTKETSTRPVSGDVEAALEKNSVVEDVKKELNKAVLGLNGTVMDNTNKVTNAIADITGGLDQCTAIDCNNRGTCIGTKKTFICACVLGYAGRTCEETMCESSRDCNGRGICFGTTNSLTCLCNLGYTGRRCEKAV
ncbi:hypothetical protein Q1695_005474 [Nippostrongylus brasiliensis]|nr:hypothetical protein Q1695_005474 [Nippostrongylus brasiliensis]